LSGPSGLSGNADLSRGEKPPTSILASKSAAGVIKTVLQPSVTIGNQVNSGALTATVYKELVNITTAGWLRLCGVSTLDATSRTIGLKIVIDGVTVFDETSAAIAATSTGFFAVGSAIGHPGVTYVSNSLELFNFNKSLTISVKSSLSETDKVALNYLTAVS